MRSLCVVHFESVKPLLNVVSVDVIELTAQPESSEGSQIAVAIDKKHSLGVIVFLGQSMQERSSWICSPLSKNCDIENQP